MEHGPDPVGPLHGLRVVELASEHAAFAGKLLGDLGAEVVVVEPASGHATRRYGPFVGDEPGIERSLWWLTYNTSKRSVTVDLPAEADRLRELFLSADIVLEGEPASRLREMQLDYEHIAVGHPGVVWIAVTPFGYHAPASELPFTDLTVLAGGGPVWSCGYDDHSLPPVRGLGNQAYHIASAWAVIGGLVAVYHRGSPGESGQLVDVSMHAAANITTEVATYEYLVGQSTVHRQTARHAAVQPTAETMAVSADGIAVNTGVAPRTGREFAALVGWMREAGLAESFDDMALLEMGAEVDRLDPSRFTEDPVGAAIYGAGREAFVHLAENLPAREYFVDAQRHGFTCGPVLTPDEFLEDPHVVARGFPVLVRDDDRGDIVYPGAPFRAAKSPWQLRPAPRLGEHNDGEPGGGMWRGNA